MKNWQQIQEEIFKESKMIELKKWIQDERKTKKIHPEPSEVFNAFKLTPYEKVKIVILGQDPYPDAKNAHGLAFSSLQLSTPASLQNIFKEIQRSLYPGKEIRELFKTNNLTKWAEQGILLINTVLTVEENKPGSHQGKGWEYFTERIISSLNDHPNKLIFMFWGKSANNYRPLVTNQRHTVMVTSHPSPMSVDKGFAGCNHFAVALELIRDDYLDIRHCVDKELIKKEIIKTYQQKNVNFDVNKINNLSIGMFLQDIKNETVIDLTL